MRRGLKGEKRPENVIGQRGPPEMAAGMVTSFGRSKARAKIQTDETLTAPAALSNAPDICIVDRSASHANHLRAESGYLDIVGIELARNEAVVARP
jgi:hypothetical protein